MFEILSTIEVVIAMLLIFVVLIQNKSVALNLSTMSGGMGATEKRGPEKALHKLTIFLGMLFILNSLALFILA